MKQITHAYIVTTFCFIKQLHITCKNVLSENECTINLNAILSNRETQKKKKVKGK
jgi:hypothetical protein